MSKVKGAVSQYLSEIGRKGGKAQVSKGIGSLPREERRALARKAIEARWAAYYAAHPEKLAAKKKRKPTGKNSPGKDKK